MLVGGQPPSGEVLEGGFLESSGTRHADTVAVEEDLELEARVEGGEPTRLVVVAREEGGQVEMIVNDLRDDAREVVLGEPLVELRREEEGLLGVVLAKDRTTLGGRAPR
jgi:hypothetical protein